jgi:lactate permease
LAFAIPQFLVSNFHGPWLVDIIASICSMVALIVLLKFWKPKAVASSSVVSDELSAATDRKHSSNDVRRAWVPWILLSVLVFIWGVPKVKDFLNGEYAVKSGKTEMRTKVGITKIDLEVPNLHKVVLRSPPVAPRDAPPEKAVFTLNWLSATGSGILLAAIFSGLFMGFSLREMARIYWQTLVRVRFSLVTIAAMLSLGYVTKYSGTDATLGLALAKTGSFYPFFGTMLGWLGVALTGSDTASNVLFGSLQKISSEQLHINPTLMAAANSSGGVMGKMVDAQSIVVASTATNWYGHEGDILRYVFFHSIALAALVGILVFAQAYISPFSAMVVK